MNVLDFVIAIAIQPLTIGFGLAGYRVRPRRPGIGLALGIAAIVLAIASLLITDLWPYRVASIAGLVVGTAAVVRPRWGAASAGLAVSGGVVWCVAMVPVLFDAVG